MTAISCPQAIEVDDITAHLRSVLETLGAPSSPGLLTPEQISELLSDLMRAGQCMRTMSPGSNEELARAVGACRVQVERLREMLPMIHGALLRERSRLATERERLTSIGAWAEASKQSL